jgi:hypothetical protein
MPSDRTVISDEQARQGVTGHGVRYVLSFGMFGAMLALVATFALLRWG